MVKINRARRNELKNGIKFLEEAIESVIYIREEENYAFICLEERFENSPTCDKMSDNIEDLGDAVDQMMNAKKILEGVLSR